MEIVLCEFLFVRIEGQHTSDVHLQSGSRIVEEEECEPHAVGPAVEDLIEGVHTDGYSTKTHRNDGRNRQQDAEHILDTIDQGFGLL